MGLVETLTGQKVMFLPVLRVPDCHWLHPNRLPFHLNDTMLYQWYINMILILLVVNITCIILMVPDDILVYIPESLFLGSINSGWR